MSFLRVFEEGFLLSDVPGLWNDLKVIVFHLIGLLIYVTYNSLQNRWHKFAKLSKIGLSMESLIADLFQISSAIDRFSFLKGRLSHRLISKSAPKFEISLKFPKFPFWWREAMQQVKNYQNILWRFVEWCALLLRTYVL